MRLVYQATSSSFPTGILCTSMFLIFSFSTPSQFNLYDFTIMICGRVQIMKLLVMQISSVNIYLTFR
jgi:hypothetical protein